MDVLLVVGKVMTSIFTCKLFTAALIREVYRIQGYMRDFTQFYRTNQLYRLTSENDDDPEKPLTEPKRVKSTTTVANTENLSKNHKKKNRRNSLYLSVMEPTDPNVL